MVTFKLDITREHCPMTFVFKTKIQLSKLNAGDVLEVLLTEGEPARKCSEKFTRTRI